MSKHITVAISREVPVGLSDVNIRRVLQLAKREIGGKISHVSVVFVPPQKIQKLNKKFRKKDVPTDVLSFVYDSEVDIVVCPKKARAVWKEAGKGLREALAFVLIHGYLHAAGFDHQTKRDYEKVMEINERVARLAKKRGYV